MNFLVLLRIIGLLIVLAVAGAGLYVGLRQNLKYDPPYPAVAATTDSSVVERGRYLVRDVASCGSCHADAARLDEVQEGVEVPLSGGFEWRIPPGEFRARNITPDPETGIGRIADGAIARALRHGVGHDGRALLPFMEMQGLADDDLAAIVSYLRSQPAVKNAVPDHHYNLLGTIVRATVLSKPIGPESPPPAVAPRGPTVENGRYLAGSVANCWACHSERDLRTGAIVNARYSGGSMAGEGKEPGQVWAAPNLTPDPKTGRLARMSEDEFVARMRAGRAIPGSPMPWQGYRRMAEDDLRAIYRFLMTLPPVENDVGPPLQTRS